MRILFVLACLGSSLARADQFHPLELPLGARPAGLGGAYTAISGDVFAIAENPAGLATIQNTNLTGSVNAFRDHKQVYQDALGDRPLNEHYASTLSFIGGSKRLAMFPDWVLAYALYAPEDTRIDRTDRLGAVPEFKLDETFLAIKAERLLRKAALGLAHTIAPGFEFGMRVAFVQAQETAIHVLYAKLGPANGGIVTTDPVYLSTFSAVEKKLDVNALEIAPGFRWKTPSLAVGIAMHGSVIISQRSEVRSEGVMIAARADGTPLAPADLEDPGDQKVTHSVDEQVAHDKVSRLPRGLQVGAAWDSGEGTLLSFAAKAGTGFVFNEDTGPMRAYVWNFAAGYESRLTPAIPLRLGLLTDLDNRTSFTGKFGPSGRTYVDNAGISAGSGFERGDSTYGLSVIYLYGKGRGVPISVGDNDDGFPVRRIKSQTVTAALTLTSTL